MSLWFKLGRSGPPYGGNRQKPWLPLSPTRGTIPAAPSP
nr:MAG TPA: hypothetical protein [Caudoviricetes sp.]